MIKNCVSLLASTFAAAAMVALLAAGSPTSAQGLIVETSSSNLTFWNADRRWRNSYSGDDSLNPDPFLSGPNPDFCIECSFPEGSQTYHGGNGG
jgi:hypothetical protein